MNKKIIAIAVAAAVSAPAAMADVKIGGQIGAALTSNDQTNARQMGDAGLSKIEFSGNEGDAFYKIGYDIRNLMGAGSAVGRDFRLGYKFGGVAIQAGRMPAALAGLEGDKYNATFLQLRRTAAVRTTFNAGSDTYVDSPILELATKAGGATIKVQYDPQDKSGVSANEGYYAVSVKGKAGAVGYFAGVNNGNGTETAGNKDQNMKIGASMKFGAANVTLLHSSADNNGAKSNANTLIADIGVGSGMSIGVAHGIAKNKDTFTRLGLTKSLTKKSGIFAGLTSQKIDATGVTTGVVGAGMKIKF